MPQAAARNAASVRNRSSHRLPMMTGGIVRLWGGNPGHEAAAAAYDEESQRPEMKSSIGIAGSVS